MSTEATPGRARLLSGALLAAVFLAGMLAGVAADHLWALHRMPPFRHGPPGHRAHRGGEAHGELARRLDLTPAQQARLDSIFARRGPRMDSIMGEMRPRLDAEIRAAEAEVEAVLTPEQREEFRRMTAERHRRMGPPGDRPPGRPPFF